MARHFWKLFALAVISIVALAAPPPLPSSYMPVDDKDSFETTKAKLEKEKPGANTRFQKLLGDRYDLSDKPIAGVTSSARNKPIQGGVRAKLPKGVKSWQDLAAMSPEDIKKQDLWPAGFFPLPHDKQSEGGMLFPKSSIDKIKAQEGRDLRRFDLDYGIPDRFLPEFPPAIYITNRSDLGDVSKGQLVTLTNHHELFNGILNPKQLEGLRLLLNPMPQQQFNMTFDRRTDAPNLGVACLDCHINGHTSGATHLVGDMRPQAHRRRIDTPSLRGLNIQRLFGSQRALKTVEDFTEFEQRAAYFDGDPVIATKKGVVVLERGSQVHFMSEVQELFDFPPAPKLNILGTLDTAKASEAELRGQQLFFGKAQCGVCHPAPYYTDNLMHNLKVERFFKEKEIDGRLASADGPIKTFPLRGIKDSPPYFHDSRLLTLEDAVEFFNLVLGTKLTEPEKKDLVAFMLAL
jgi:cytochrome c peroxidase